MKKNYFLLYFLLISFFGVAQNVTITKVIETGCASPYVKSVELYVDGTVDFSSEVVLNYMNNGGAWANTQIDVSALGSITDSFVYIVRDIALMQTEFPAITFDTTNTVVTGSATNGDDGYQVVLNGTVVSQFGKTETDADNDTESDWNHKDAVATRKDGMPDVGAWDRSHWDITAENDLDAHTSCQTDNASNLETYFATLGSTYSLGSGSGWTPIGATCSTVLNSTSATCVTTVAGATDDTYAATIDFSGGNTGKTFVINSTSGTVGGDDPTSVVSGTITISGIAEGTDITVTVNDTADGGVCTLSADIESPGCVPLVLNEVLFDPASDDSGTTDVIEGDANGDGERSSSQDEFIEFFNNSNSALDISGYSVSDASLLRHTFPEATIIPAKGVLVLFGGGIPTGTFGNGIVQTANVGNGTNSDDFQLSLNNSGDIITVKNNADDIVLEYSSSATGISHSENQSVTRSPDITGNFALHMDANASLSFSPGLNIDGVTLSNTIFEIKSFEIYPNPISRSERYLKVTSSINKVITVVIFDVLGKQITKQTAKQNSVDISNLKNGMYLMRVSQGSNTTTKKIIITN